MRLRKSNEAGTSHWPRGRRARLLTGAGGADLRFPMSLTWSSVCWTETSLAEVYGVHLLLWRLTCTLYSCQETDGAGDREVPKWPSKSKP